MIIRLITLILLSLTAPTESVRGLPPGREHDPPAVNMVYLPIVSAQAEVSASTKSIDRTLYGLASPHRRSYTVPFYNWRAIAQDCQNPNFWPMVRGQAIESNMLSECDNGTRWLLIYNEPELDHFSATPKQAASFVHEWASKWEGPVSCCGFGSCCATPRSPGAPGR